MVLRGYRQFAHRHGLRFQHVTHGIRNAVERVYREVKRPTKPVFKYVQSC